MSSSSFTTPPPHLRTPTGPKPVPAASRTINYQTITKKKIITSRELKELKVSPLQSAEDLAARLGRDLTISELNRLFHGPSPPFEDNTRPRRPVRVAYQGVRGSYCHDAASRAFTSPDTIPCDHFEDAFSAIESRSADRAVVIAENSLDGPVDRNLDLLLRHPDVKIVGEIVLPVNHCLLGLRTMTDIKRVVSHPQALAHCEPRLDALGVAIEEVSCAADAAKYISDHQISDTAVIGSKIAANEFGLQILEENLQGHVGNFTRFFQLAGADAAGVAVAAAAGAPKTTVAFCLENGASELYNAMMGFENQGVRVSRVDHRPNRANPVRVDRVGTVRMDYVFVIDVEGSEGDEGVMEGIRRLREFAGFVRVLGSYTCGGRL